MSKSTGSAGGCSTGSERSAGRCREKRARLPKATAIRTVFCCCGRTMTGDDYAVAPSPLAEMRQAWGSDTGRLLGLPGVEARVLGRWARLSGVGWRLRWMTSRLQVASPSVCSMRCADSNPTAPKGGMTCNHTCSTVQHIGFISQIAMQWPCRGLLFIFCLLQQHYGLLRMKVV